MTAPATPTPWQATAESPSREIAQFFIPAAASLQERRPRTLKHDDTFAVFDHNGDALSGPGSPEGIYHRDTRYLSHLYLTLDGHRPLLLSSTLRDDNATLTCDLTNPDLYDANGNVTLPHDLLHVRRSRFLWDGVCHERIMLANYDSKPHTVRLQLSFAADFADIFEVRGTSRPRRGTAHPPVFDGHRVELTYTGLDDRHLGTVLRFDPRPDKLSGNEATWVAELPPRATQYAFVEVRCRDDCERLDGERSVASAASAENVRRSFFLSLREARRSVRSFSSGTCVTTSNEIFDEAFRRSVSDIYMLVTATPQGSYPYAGVPWFSTAFGRDAIITALETLWVDPSIACGVLDFLAANQAKTFDAAADAEPGKILHEVRQGEMAILGEVPFRRYYGSIDSTPLFVMLAGALLQRTNDVGLLARLWPNIEAALHWIEHHGDRDGDGFVEYGRYTEAGLLNQGWKDSHDSVFHADGTIARGPIALVEVQAYVYGAWLAAAGIAERLGFNDAARLYKSRATTLRDAFDRQFFDEDLGTYVLALDGEKQRCRVRTSNAGHALYTGIARRERAASVVRTLMDINGFCGWGVRTVADREARFNPMSYHNGSVWPHDNALVAAGMARYGFRAAAARIFEGMFAASTYIDLRRLPELFCGFARQHTQGPTFYPVACMPQAWAAAAPLLMLQSCLGLGFRPTERVLSFTQPTLPAFLEEVVLRNVTLGEGAVDVALRRSGRGVVVDILGRRGDLRVQTCV